MPQQVNATARKGWSILTPDLNVFLSVSWRAADGCLIHLKTTILRQHFMAAKCGIQQGRIRQERVRHDTQFTAYMQMCGRTTDQHFRRRQTGLNAIMERWVRNNHLEAAFDVGIDIAGNHLCFNIIRRQCRSAGFDSCRRDITQGPFDFWRLLRQNRGQYARTTTDIQHAAFKRLAEGGQQQMAA